MSVENITQDLLPLRIPRSICVCPICGADVVVEEVRVWEADTGKPLEVGYTCVTEPDIDGDEWEDWHAGHFEMPYVDWLPLEGRVLKWLRKNYRMEVQS